MVITTEHAELFAQTKEIRSRFQQLLSTAMSSENEIGEIVKELEDGFDKSVSEINSISMVDQQSSFEISVSKFALDTQTRADVTVENVQNFMNIVIATVESGKKIKTGKNIEGVEEEIALLTGRFVIKTLESFYGAFPISFCEPLFSILESNIDKWNSTKYGAFERNSILKICNLLLQRLSKSQNTDFCGRVLIYLAKFFPLTEQSGVNKYGDFNIENTTAFDEEEEVERSLSRRGSIMDMDEQEQLDVTIDYELYSKFWVLQKYFSAPDSCYEEFAKLQNCTTAVLETLCSVKPRSSKNANENKLENNSNKGENEEYNQYRSQTFSYPKFLTSRNLIALQLQDSQFRATILIQMLILCQYLLNGPPKNKVTKHSAVLGSDAIEWVKKTHTRCLNMTSTVSSSGDIFQQAVERLLERETAWSEWKDTGCPQFDAEQKPFSFKMKKPFNIVTSVKSRQYLGQPKLTNLFKTDAASLEDLKKNNHIPSGEDFFENAVAQIDPEAKCDEEYCAWNDKMWAPKAYRILTMYKPMLYQKMQKGEIREAVDALFQEQKPKKENEFTAPTPSSSKPSSPKTNSKPVSPKTSSKPASPKTESMDVENKDNGKRGAVKRTQSNPSDNDSGNKRIKDEESPEK